VVTHGRREELGTQYLLQALGSFLGARIIGGEASVVDVGTRKFLPGFIDQFAILVAWRGSFNLKNPRAKLVADPESAGGCSSSRRSRS
jgi:hypothetical protein